MRLSAAPTGNVVVTLTRSGSTAITSSPGTVTLTTGNWSSGRERDVHGGGRHHGGDLDVRGRGA